MTMLPGPTEVALLLMLVNEEIMILFLIGIWIALRAWPNENMNSELLVFLCLMRSIWLLPLFVLATLSELRTLGRSNVTLLCLRCVFMHMS